MYLLKTEKSFDAAHFLKGYRGKCSNIHGHRWNVAVEVQSESLVCDGQLRGMVVDFKTLKHDLAELADHFDHSLIYEENSLKPSTLCALKEEGFQLTAFSKRPTAENLSFWFCSALQKKGYDVCRVSVYETPDNCAVYAPCAREVSYVG
ncbi:MAG: 6-carboxytetrahydropterin synthase [Lachnospiraceae bacterium]|nr:6-carboxytetrahydropterin synthase [Lachnospiraceae bacterium]